MYSGTIERTYIQKSKYMIKKSSCQINYNKCLINYRKKIDDIKFVYIKIKNKKWEFLYFILKY